MKLKKLVSLCSKNGVFSLYDRISADGELTEQWLGDGNAMYPLNGLPVLDEDTLCAVFDISEKQREKIMVTRQRIPESVNVLDIDPKEKLLNNDGFSLICWGEELKPLKTSSGITVIQSKYLSPLEDVRDGMELYERRTAAGISYIVAKAGLLVVGVIMPYSIINEKFVAWLEEVAAESRRMLEHQPAENHDHDQQIL